MGKLNDDSLKPVRIHFTYQLKPRRPQGARSCRVRLTKEVSQLSLWLEFASARVILVRLDTTRRMGGRGYGVRYLDRRPVTVWFPTKHSSINRLYYMYMYSGEGSK